MAYMVCAFGNIDGFSTCRRRLELSSSGFLEDGKCNVVENLETYQYATQRVPELFLKDEVIRVIRN
jgi:hypothetical protein